MIRSKVNGLVISEVPYSGVVVDLEKGKFAERVSANQKAKPKVSVAKAAEDVPVEVAQDVPVKQAKAKKGKAAPVEVAQDVPAEAVVEEL